MLLLETRRKDKQTRWSAVAASDGALIAHKPAVCGRDFPIACLRTASRASTASNRGGNVFFCFAPPCASLARCSVPAHFVCSALQPFGPSPFCKHLHPQFAIVDLHLRTVPLLAARCSVAAHCASLRVLATSTLRVSDARKLACSSPLCPQFAIVALLRYRLQVSFAHWTSASPVSRTARGLCAPFTPSGLGILASGYGLAYFRASPSKLPGLSQPSASLTAARFKREVARRSRDGGIGRRHGATADTSQTPRGSFHTAFGMFFNAFLIVRTNVSPYFSVR